MKVFNRYIFRMLLMSTIMVSVILAMIILLTQSMRFLELVINSGASTTMFWFLTLLALPRFMEVILPIALMTSTIFVYNKMNIDSELVVMRSTGTSPWSLAKPAIMLSFFIGLVLLLMTTWVAPKSLSSMQNMRQIVKAQYSAVFLRQGIFNELGDGVMAFIRKKTNEGEMRGILIYDSRKDNKSPVTILAKKGVMVEADDGYQVVVYDGSRQDINADTGSINRLDFSRYTIDLPDGSSDVRKRWKEAEERTLWELFHPDPDSRYDKKNMREFSIEIHRRIISPLLAPTFTVVALSIMLLGPLNRKGQGGRIGSVIAASIFIQGSYLAAYSIARDHNIGIYIMYLLVFLPLGIGIFMLGDRSENIRKNIAASFKDKEVLT